MHKVIVYPGNHPEVIKDAIVKRGNYQCVGPTDEFKDIELIWRPTNFNQVYYEKLDKEKSIIFNHLPNLKGICVKANLISSLRKFYSNYAPAVAESYDVFYTTPTTYIIAADKEEEFLRFLFRYKEYSQKNYSKELIPSKHCEQNVWIVKPSHLNQGRGIEVFNNFIDIQKFLNGKKGTYIIQKYIEKPLLYYNRKFDIRVWALVTCTGQLYYYKYGYLRTSSSEFSLSENTKWVHLTNNCFQCNGEKYGKFEEGNTLAFSAFQEYLDKTNSGINVDLHIIPRIKDIIIDTYMSVMDEANPNKRANCFELLGFDFMVDEDYRVWLIECNENPYIGIPNEYIRGMLPQMLNNMLRLVLDPYLPPLVDPFIQEPQNYWELIFEYRDSTIILNKRRPFNLSVYPLEKYKQPKV